MAMIPAFITHRGHESAGAIYLKINLLNGFCKIYSPAPAAFNADPMASHDDRLWVDYFEDKPQAETQADQWLAEQLSYDSDIWIIEIEDKSGNSYLEKQQITKF